MGSDNNCRNFYSEVSTPSSYYYENNEHHSSNNPSSDNNNNNNHNHPNSVVQLKTVSSERGWISSDQTSGSLNNLNEVSRVQEQENDSHEQQNSAVNELKSKTYNNHQHYHHSPQWNFGSTLGNSYRLYNDYHYIISPNTPQPCALVAPCATSVQNQNSKSQTHHHIHPMQTTTHHLKKLYYQGSKGLILKRL